MNRIGIIIGTLICLNVQAQKRILDLFSLSENPQLHEVDSTFIDESLVIIEDYRAVNINYRKEAINQYQVNTVHKIIHINNALGVKIYNEISIPIEKGEELLNLEVRTISKNNKVYEMQNHEPVDVTIKGNIQFKKFAVEGLEVGGEVEFLYSKKSRIKPYKRIYFKSLYPTQKLKFELFEKNVIHSAASYNGLAPVESIHGNLVCEDYNIEGIDDETLSSFQSKIKHIDYKVEQYGDYYDGTSWKRISGNILEQFQSESMRINNFIYDMNLDGLTEFEKVCKVEEYIKSNIAIEYNLDKSYTDLMAIQKNKLANYEGVIKLYLKCFQKLQIPVSLIMSTSRYSGLIDESYPHTMDLEYPILYFPNLDKYLTTNDMALRLGMPPAEFGKSHVLKIKTNNSTALASLKYDTCEFVTLPILEAKYNTTQRIINVQLAANNTQAKIHYLSKKRGYFAIQSRLLINEYLEGDHNRLNNTFMGIDVVEIDSVKFENEGFVFSTKPSTSVNTDIWLNTESIVEQLEDDILVSLGQLIKPQSKMYGEGKRQHDVVLEFPKLYESRIHFTIPEGYTCMNLEELKKHLYFMFDKENSIYFDLSYVLKDNQLSIVIKNGYNTILINKKHYKDYQEVVNSVADFRAFTLILEKE